MSFTSALAHPGVRWIGLGWTGFIGENLVLSHNRQAIINRFGNQKYHMIYNSFSMATCGSIAYGFFKYGRGGGPMRALPGLGALVLADVCRTAGLAGMFQMMLPRFSLNADVDVDAEREAGAQGVETNVDKDGISGLKRITRHPFLWSFALLGAGHALASPFWAQAAMGAGPVAMTLLCGNHMEYRYRRGNGGKLTPELEARTSFTPFLALATGAQSWGDLWCETDKINLAIAVAASAFLGWRGRVRLLRLRRKVETH